MLAIYSSTIVSIDYFGDNNSKLPEPRHEMRMFHEPSPEIRKNEIELEKQYRQNDVSREISKIDSILKNLENKIDVLFLGTGHEICHIPEDFRKTIEKMGLNLEIMSTPSACRTYNVLLSEGRRIAIAALAVEGR